MNARSNSMAAPAETRARRIGENPEASYEIANLTSIITVCAVALDGSDEWTDEIARGIRHDVQHVLEWAALIATEINVKVERLEAGRSAK